MVHSRFQTEIIPFNTGRLVPTCSGIHGTLEEIGRSGRTGKIRLPSIPPSLIPRITFGQVNT